MFFPFLSFPQNCGIDFDRTMGLWLHSKKVPIGEGFSEKQKKELILKKSCLYSSSVSNKHKSILANNIASHYYYFTNENDSIKKYIQLAYEYDQDWFQYHIVFIDDLFNLPYPKEHLRAYYLDDTKLRQEFDFMFDFDYSKYLEQIYQKRERRKSGFKEGHNIDYKNAIKKIKLNDQKYRGEEITNKAEQATLDLKNRELLDSLYNVYGFPSKEKIGSKVSITPWLVLQHSTDCEWNEKWLKRHLQAYKNEERDIGFLPQTFHRFYNQENGYCTQEDKKDRANLFIKSLKEDFSEEYQDIFGYKNYY